MPEAQQDYYRMLGVPRDASDRAIKRAYYDLARRLHPDKAPTPEEATRNAAELALLSRAYNTLKDQRKREEYDALIRARPAIIEPPPARPAPSSRDRAPVAPASADQQEEGDGRQGRAAGYTQSDILAHKKAIAQKAFVKGMQHFRRQEYKEALGFFEAAVNNDPESEAQYHLKYAQCLIQLKGSFTKAVEHGQTACQMEPYKLEFKLILADIYETAGVTSKARHLYEEVLRWESTNQTAKLRLSLLDQEDAKGSVLLRKLKTILAKGRKPKG